MTGFVIAVGIAVLVVFVTWRCRQERQGHPDMSPDERIDVQEQAARADIARRRMQAEEQLRRLSRWQQW